MKLIHWDEMPDFEIYSDQLVTIVNKELSFLNIEITQSMVNNYVKHKVMPLPIKKRYGQSHIAYLILISLLKATFSMEEIKLYLEKYPPKTNYDTFCDIFERLWEELWKEREKQTQKDRETFALTNSLSLSEKINLLMASTVISKLQATNLLQNKGEDHATITS